MRRERSGAAVAAVPGCCFLSLDPWCSPLKVTGISLPPDFQPTEVKLSTQSGSQETGSLLPVWIIMMVPVNHPRQGRALPSGSPLSRVRLRPPLTSKVLQRAALFWPSPPFHQEPSKIPDIPAISGAMFIWQEEGLGRCGVVKKEPHSQTVWVAFESKHAQAGYVKRAVSRTEAHVFWS